MSDAPIFWDIMGPTLIIVFFLLVWWFYHALKKKEYTLTIISSLLEGMIALVFAWSIGIFLAIVPLTQVIIMIYLFIRKEPESS